jgi:cysteine desulfurase/selenocysteine lyase
VDLDHTSYQNPPLRFEAGTPIIGSVIALKTALEFVEAHRKPDSLLSLATDLLSAIPGLKIIGTAPEKGPIISFHVEGIHPLDLATFLDLRHFAIRSGHLCAQPLLRKFGLSAAARISFGVYNTREEIKAFAEALTSICTKLCV